MRKFALFFCFFHAVVFAQPEFEKKTYAKYKSCSTKQCSLSSSFALAEYYMEDDQLKRSQHWLGIVEELHHGQTQDTMAYFVNSLQSELFYYMGLFQFGAHEAEKAYSIAKIQKDSALMADAKLFIGINQFEMGNFDKSEKALYDAKRFFPKLAQRKRLRFLARDEHIFNNIAQLKLAQRQLDSASWYVLRAQKFAEKYQSKRGIPNVLQTRGRILLAQGIRDSARFFLNRSCEAAMRERFYDILLINQGYLMESTDDAPELDRLYNFSRQIIRDRDVNLTFQSLFYQSALDVFRKQKNQQKTLEVQDEIIKINSRTRVKGNEYVQQISNQYMRNENKLLSLRITELQKQRNLIVLELVAAVLCVVILVLTVFLIRRKNKLQKTLLDQKNDISKDLHDDIGSGLSSILIHADLLHKSENASAKQQLLASKIEATGKEVSQRLNTFIWSLNNDNNSIQNFCEYVKFYGNRLFEGTSIAFEYHQEIWASSEKTINGHARKNLFFCVKEMLNNVLKHSQATKVWLEISTDRKSLFISAYDNGVGLREHNKFGNGLNNIRKRIDQLGGTLGLSGENGLEVKIQVPL